MGVPFRPRGSAACKPEPGGNLPLRRLIERAYNLKPNRLVAPKAIHRESKELPGSVLVVAKSGFKPSGAGFNLRGTSVPLGRLAY